MNLKGGDIGNVKPLPEAMLGKPKHSHTKHRFLHNYNLAGSAQSQEGR